MTRRCGGLAYLLLSFNDVRELRVRDPWVELTLHEGGSLVVFDVAQVPSFRDFDVFGEALRGHNKSLKRTGFGGEDGSRANANVTPAVPAS